MTGGTEPIPQHDHQPGTVTSNHVLSKRSPHCHLPLTRTW